MDTAKIWVVSRVSIAHVIYKSFIGIGSRMCFFLSLTFSSISITFDFFFAFFFHGTSSKCDFQKKRIQLFQSTVLGCRFHLHLFALLFLFLSDGKSRNDETYVRHFFICKIRCQMKNVL